MKYNDWRSWNLAIITGFLPIMIYDLGNEKSWLIIGPIIMYLLMTFYFRRLFK